MNKVEAEGWAQRIFLHLTEEGFEVYFPAQKVGECLSPYVVVKEVTTSQYLDYSSTITYYDLMCYVPKDNYSQVEPFMERVKKSMKKLMPMMKPTYSETQSFYDDTVKGHMKSVQYKNFRQIIV